MEKVNPARHYRVGGRQQPRPSRSAGSHIRRRRRARLSRGRQPPRDWLFQRANHHRINLRRAEPSERKRQPQLRRLRRRSNHSKRLPTRRLANDQRQALAHQANRVISNPSPPANGSSIRTQPLISIT